MSHLHHLTGPAVLQTLAEAIVITDTDWTIQFINAAAYRLLELYDRDIVGTSFTEVAQGLGELPPEQRAAIAQGIQTIIASDQNHAPLEARGVEWIAGQPPRPLAFRATPIWSGESGVAIGILIRIDDKPLEWTPRDLLNAIWHDLRMPVTSIQGFADLLLRDMAGPLTNTQREFISHIRANAARLLALRTDYQAYQGQVTNEHDQQD